MAADSSGRDLVDRLETAMRASRATSISVRVGDEWREITAPRTRGRWRRMAELAVRMEADAVRCCIGDQIVESISLDDETPPPAPIASEPARVEDGELGRFAALLRLVIEAQDRAVARHTEQARGITDAAIGVMRAATDRAAVAERTAQAMMDERARDLALAANTLDARAEEAEATRDEAGLDQMVTQLVQLHAMKGSGK